MTDLPSASLAPDGTIALAITDEADSLMVRRIQGRQFKGGRGTKLHWTIPCTDLALRELRQHLPLVQIAPEIQHALTNRAFWESKLQRAKDGHPGNHEWSNGLISATPYAHQEAAHRIGLTLMEQAPGFGLGHEVGCGKTITSLAMVGKMWSERKASANLTGTDPALTLTVLVVCPASVIGVWTREVAKFVNYPARCVELTGSVAKRAGKVAATMIEDFDGVTMFVVNYDVLWRPVLLETLCKTRIDVMICDEAHRLKNPGSAQSKAARKIARTAKRIPATGTPVDSLTDWYGIYRWLDPSVFGSSFTAFRARYFDTWTMPNGIQVITGVKAEMLAELLEKAHSMFHIVKKEDALDLPETIDVERTFQLEPAAMKMYLQMKRDAITFLESGEAAVGSNALTRLLRQQQITGGYLRADDGTVSQVSTAKLGVLKETVNDILEQQRKVVIFARFTPEIDAIMLAVGRKRTGLRAVQDEHAAVIDGRVPIGAARSEIIDRFQDPESDLRVLVVQVRAGGAGITLHAAHTVIYYSVGHSLIEYDQSRGRVHRVGQTNRCTYIHLLAENTVDEKVLDALRSKQSIASMTPNQLKELL